MSFAIHRIFDSCSCVVISFISAISVYTCLTLSILLVGCTCVKESNVLDINADDGASTGAKKSVCLLNKKYKFSKE
jgi:hypothetical protein